MSSSTRPWVSFARARCAACGHDFLVPFAGKGRGVCPSCTTRRMAETAAHLVDHVFAQVPVRQWGLSLPKRLRYRGFLPAEAVETRQAWEHDGGFCVNAEVWVPSWDRAGLERLIRYCARPLFAGKRLAWLQPEQRRGYRRPKPRPDGQMVLNLTPPEFLDHLAALIPPPRKHRHRYHGVLAPHSPLRAAVTARAGLPCDGSAGALVPRAPAVSPDARTAAAPPAADARYLWAVLIARIYTILPLICPVCGNEMRLIAAVTEPEPVRRLLLHVGEPTTPPPISPARSPPRWDTVDWEQTPAAILILAISPCF